MTQTSHRILVAEDNAALASVVRFSLESAGYQVEVARNGRLAWELFDEQPFDLVVTDQQMPEMTGIELCEHITASRGAMSVPIILLTAKGLELDLPHLRNTLGISAAYAKPFSPAQVVQTVQELLLPVAKS